MKNKNDFNKELFRFISVGTRGLVARRPLGPHTPYSARFAAADMVKNQFSSGRIAEPNLIFYYCESSGIINLLGKAFQVSLWFGVWNFEFVSSFDVRASSFNQSGGLN